MPFGPLMTDLRKRACQLQALQEAEGYDEIFAQLTKACGYLKTLRNVHFHRFLGWFSAFWLGFLSLLCFKAWRAGALGQCGRGALGEGRGDLKKSWHRSVRGSLKGHAPSEAARRGLVRPR